MADSIQIRDWYLVVFYGIDLLGSQCVLFVSISKESSYKHMLSILEKYVEAGFKPPEVVLAQNQQLIDAFKQKFGQQVNF